MGFFRIFLFLPVLLVTGTAWSVQEVDPISGAVADETAMAELRKGTILVENTRTDESGGSVRVQAMIHGQLADFWDYIASCEKTFDYVDGIRSCELLSLEHSEGSDIATLRQAVKKSWVIPGMEYTLTVRREPPGRVDFKLIEGDLKEMEGGWRFISLVGETAFIATHEIRVRPSFPVPRWLIRRTMRGDVPDMLACLRGLVNGSGSFSKADDLKRCPKPKG